MTQRPLLLVKAITVIIIIQYVHQISTPSRRGEKFLVALYGGNPGVDNPGTLRLQLLQKSVIKQSCHLARLPPTIEASTHHSCRTYLQVQTWLGNNVLPTSWGWSLTSSGIVPTKSNRNAAPVGILSVLSCKCRKGCSSAACSCKKAGLLCSDLCKHCAGR